MNDQYTIPGHSEEPQIEQLSSSSVESREVAPSPERNILDIGVYLDAVRKQEMQRVS